MWKQSRKSPRGLCLMCDRWPCLYLPGCGWPLSSARTRVAPAGLAFFLLALSASLSTVALYASGPAGVDSQAAVQYAVHVSL
jgi:hypothetical protein